MDIFVLTPIFYPNAMDNTNMIKLNKAGDSILDCSNEIKGIVEIPDGIKCITFGAFKCCTGLTSIIIPNSVTRIEDCAFADCTGLTSIKIPNSVKGIGQFANQ